MISRIMAVLLCILCAQAVNAQDFTSIPDKFLKEVKEKSERFEKKLMGRTEKALARMQKQERRMQQKLDQVENLWD